ncbi:unnamed protein product [Ambrosiozyma monospora]|uniref:Unnamed protein product n=1 Tax=Ambrosiozyma monospora TaxID=43982 RepID=A0A9W6Z0H4_AMBMO|nr:unnamed protein product [Ambrosiozyma monospora]
MWLKKKINSDYDDNNEEEYEGETDNELDYKFKTTIRSVLPECAADSVFKHALSRTHRFRRLIEIETLCNPIRS